MDACRWTMSICNFLLKMVGDCYPLPGEDVHNINHELAWICEIEEWVHLFYLSILFAFVCEMVRRSIVRMQLSYGAHTSFHEEQQHRGTPGMSGARIPERSPRNGAHRIHRRTSGIPVIT